AARQDRPDARSRERAETKHQASQAAVYRSFLRVMDGMAGNVMLVALGAEAAVVLSDQAYILLGQAIRNQILYGLPGVGQFIEQADDRFIHERSPFNMSSNGTRIFSLVLFLTM